MKIKEEKTLCRELYRHKYQNLFRHLYQIINNFNIIFKDYGYELSEKEIEEFDKLIYRLETGKYDIIEFGKKLK